MKTTNNTTPVKADTRKTSNLVKKMLKEKFGIDCSVKSEKYSGGCSINIEYNLGPDQKIVDSLLSGLQYGHFNSMEDIYESSNEHKAIIFDGFELESFKYCFVRQKISNELKAKFFESYKQNFSSNSEDWQKEQDFFRHFEVKNFVTQNEAEIENIKAVFNYDTQRLEILYSVNGVEYNTAHKIEAPKVENQPTFEQVPTEAGTVQIIEYSERAVAVIGDTKPIKETLKSLGGKFNFRLSCGPGWIFPKTKLQTIQTALA